MAIPRTHESNGGKRIIRLLRALLCCALYIILAPAYLTGVSAQTPAPPTELIAFERANDIWVMNPDGSNQKRIMRFGLEPAWSPDGKRIAYRCGDGDVNNIICLMNADGTNVKQLATSLADFGPSWSPDGKKIVFSRKGDAGLFYRVYIVDLENNNSVRPLYPDGPGFERGEGFAPAWSPDGTRIAFIRGGESSRPEHGFVYSAPVDADGNPTGDPSFIGGDEFCGNLAWSPDGNYIAYDTLLGVGFLATKPGLPHRNGFLITTDWDDTAGYPSFSSDGKRLAYYYENVTHILDEHGFPVETRRESHVYVYDMDVHTTTRLPVNDAGTPSLRPDVPFGGNTPAGTNVTVTVGGVTITFAGVQAEGQTTVTPISPGQAGALPGGYRLGQSGVAYEVHTTAVYTGPITLTFNVTGSPTQAAFSRLRVLHNEGGSLIDRTVLAPGQPAPNFQALQISARTASLSPFVVAELEEVNSPPVARAKNVELTAGPDGTASLNPAALDNGSSDPDEGDAITLAAEPAGPFAVGVHEVTLVVTDTQGASSSATATVSVSDKTAPVINSAPPAGDLTAGENCLAALPDLRGEVTATDNVTPPAALVVTQSPAPGSLVSAGSHTVSFTVSDAAGNTAQAQTGVAVLDKTAPQVTASLTRLKSFGQLKTLLQTDFQATDACAQSLMTTALIETPAGAQSFRVVFEREALAGGVSEVRFDLRHARIILKGRDEASLRGLLARLLPAGGAAVARGQKLLFHQTGRGAGHNDAQHLVYVFAGDALTAVKAPALRLKVTSRDPGGNVGTATASR